MKQLNYTKAVVIAQKEGICLNSLVSEALVERVYSKQKLTEENKNERI